MKEELKGVHPFLKTLTNELSSLKANINEIRGGRSNSNPHECQCHDRAILIRELQEMKADNRKFLEEMSIRSHRVDRTPLNTKKTDDEGLTNRGILTSTSKPPQNDQKDSQTSMANELKPTTKPQAKAKTEINTDAPVSKNDSSVSSISSKTKDTSKLLYSMKEELKGVHQFLKTLTNELSSLKASINEIRGGRSNSNPHGCQCHDRAILIRELQEMKADNRKFLEEMSIRSHRVDRTPLNTKKTDDEGLTNRGILTSTSKPPQNDQKDSQTSMANELKPTTKPQAKAKTEINTDAPVSKNDSSVSSISSKTKDTSKSSNDIDTGRPQKVED